MSDSANIVYEVARSALESARGMEALGSQMVLICRRMMADAAAVATPFNPPDADYVAALEAVAVAASAMDARDSVEDFKTSDAMQAWQKISDALDTLNEDFPARFGGAVKATEDVSP